MDARSDKDSSKSAQYRLGHANMAATSHHTNAIDHDSALSCQLLWEHP